MRRAVGLTEIGLVEETTGSLRNGERLAQRFGNIVVETRCYVL